MSDRDEKLAIAALAALGALPSLVWALTGGTLLTDDWAVWFEFEKRGVLQAMWRLAFEQPARPLAAPYYLLTHWFVNDAPIIQGLLIGALNAGLVVAAWWAGRSLVPASILWPALVVLALAPNHASTRLWFVVGNYVLALTLVLMAFSYLQRGQPRTAAVAFAAGVLLYEGVVALAVILLVVWMLPARGRIRTGALVGAPMFVSAALMLVLSPKSTGGAEPFSSVGTFGVGQFGAGLWGDALGPLGATLALVLVTMSLARQLPSFRSERTEYRYALVGAALMLGGAGPFVYSGSPFAASGIFDRNNLVPGVGMALLCGAGVSLLLRDRPSIFRAAVAAVGAWFLVLTVRDIKDYRDAAAEGEEVIATVAEAGRPGVGEMLVVGPELAGRRGVADFVYSNDFIAALTFRVGGDWSGVHIVNPFTNCNSIVAGRTSFAALDHRSGTRRQVSMEELISVCESWRR